MESTVEALTETRTMPARPSLLAQFASRYGVEPDKMLATLKATVFDSEASNEEMVAFLTVAHRYELDPFRGEIYAFRKKGKKGSDGEYERGGIQAIVGIDGWASILNRHPEADGFEFEDCFTDDRTKLISTTCRIFRKDRSRPSVVTEYLQECARGTIPWNQWPARMLRHKAFIQCARLAFGISGVIDEDEAQRIKWVEAQEVKPSAPAAKQVTNGAPTRGGKSLDTLAAKTNASAAPATPADVSSSQQATEAGAAPLSTAASGPVVLTQSATVSPLAAPKLDSLMEQAKGYAVLLGPDLMKQAVERHGGDVLSRSYGLGTDGLRALVNDLAGMQAQRQQGRAS